MTSRSRIGASAFSVNDGSDRSAVTVGYHSSWNASLGPPVVAGQLRHHRGEVGAGRVAGDGNPVRVAAQLGGVLADPLQRGPAVVHPGRERMLRGEPVVDGHHDGLGADGVCAGDRIVGVQVAQRETAAVVEDDDRQVAVLGDRRPVDADRDVGELTVPDNAILDAQIRQHFRGCLQLAQLRARDLDAVGGVERHRERVDQCLQRRVDLRSGGGRLRHGPTVRTGSCSAVRSAASPRSMASVAAGTTPA